MKLIETNILSGDFFFVKGTSLYAFAIKLNTFSRFTHIGIAVWIELNGMKRLCIFEAMSGHGVRLYPIDKYLIECKKRREKIYWYKLHPSINRETVVQYASIHWGKRYASVWQMIYSFGWLMRSFKKIFGWLDKDLDKERFFCSEYGAGALRFAGVKTKLPASLSPGELTELPWLINQGELTL